LQAAGSYDQDLSQMLKDLIAKGVPVKGKIKGQAFIS